MQGKENEMNTNTAIGIFKMIVAVIGLIVGYVSGHMADITAFMVAVQAAISAAGFKTSISTSNLDGTTPAIPVVGKPMLVLLCAALCIGSLGCQTQIPYDTTINYGPDGKTPVSQITTPDIPAMQALAAINSKTITDVASAGVTMAGALVNSGISIEQAIASVKAAQATQADAQNLAILTAALNELNKLAGKS